MLATLIASVLMNYHWCTLYMLSHAFSVLAEFLAIVVVGLVAGTNAADLVWRPFSKMTCDVSRGTFGSESWHFIENKNESYCKFVLICQRSSSCTCWVPVSRSREMAWHVRCRSSSCTGLMWLLSHNIHFVYVLVATNCFFMEMCHTIYWWLKFLSVFRTMFPVVFCNLFAVRL